jgi:hypothetical protein
MEVKAVDPQDRHVERAVNRAFMGLSVGLAGAGQPNRHMRGNSRQASE